MIEINLIDEAGVLSPSEFERLRDFIINNCLCTSDEVAKLQAVKLRNDGAVATLATGPGSTPELRLTRGLKRR